MTMLRRLTGMLLMLLPLATAMAADPEAPTIQIVISEHKFEPAEIQVPANVKVKLVIENRDATPEEFESYELNREKIVPGKGTITVFVGPLKPGRYPFFGEFNQATAQGALIAK
jgi:Cupredoxin-like domain